MCECWLELDAEEVAARSPSSWHKTWNFDPKTHEEEAAADVIMALKVRQLTCDWRWPVTSHLLLLLLLLYDIRPQSCCESLQELHREISQFTVSEGSERRWRAETETSEWLNICAGKLNSSLVKDRRNKNIEKLDKKIFKKNTNVRKHVKFCRRLVSVKY